MPAALRLTQTVQTQRFGGGWSVPPSFAFTSQVIPLQRVNSAPSPSQGPISCTNQDANFNSTPDESDALICCQGHNGNVDEDAGDIVDISDVTAMVDYATYGFPISTCFAENDADRSGAIDISDLMALIDDLTSSLHFRSVPKSIAGFHRL